MDSCEQQINSQFILEHEKIINENNELKSKIKNLSDENTKLKKILEEWSFMFFFIINKL